MSVSIKLENGKAMEQALKELGKKVAVKIAKTAVDAGASPMIAAVRTSAQSKVGGKMGTALANAAEIKLSKKGRSVIATIDLGYGNNDEFIYISKAGKRSYIPFAIEYGHIVARGNRKKNLKNLFGLRAGEGKDFVAPIPFMRSAFVESAPTAQAKTMSTLEAGIKAEFEKINTPQGGNK